MATMKASALAVLTGDAPLVAVFTGGFFDADGLPNRGLTFDTIEKESNGVTIKPTGVMRWRGPNPMRGPDVAAMYMVDVFFYDDVSNGRDNIDYGKRRVWDLLHDTYIGNTDNEGLVMFHWVGDLGEAPDGADRDDALTANMDRSTFQVTITRKSTS